MPARHLPTIALAQARRVGRPRLRRVSEFRNPEFGNSYRTDRDGGLYQNSHKSK